MMETQQSVQRVVGSIRTDTLLLDIDDFNALISILKRREENIIQALDYNLKYRGSSVEEETQQLKSLYSSLHELEKSRLEKENEILAKYDGVKVGDPKQKK